MPHSFASPREESFCFAGIHPLNLLLSGSSPASPPPHLPAWGLFDLNRRCHVREEGKGHVDSEITRN